ncbi:MAG: methyltransferase domain-containing protein [Caldicoprobacterales bacterium]|jgi:hypothetical protein
MDNPWMEIELDDYEKHMSHETVFQLQEMDQIMKSQFYTYPVESVQILGIAGGNGLEHINCCVFKNVYGVDINEKYLVACKERYPQLKEVFSTICTDLTSDNLQLPYSDLLIANLLIEYIGYKCFQNIVKIVAPRYVSCVIQINTGEEFVSDSPYLHVFDRLEEVHYQIEDNVLTDAMSHIGYKCVCSTKHELPNGKALLRIDYTK